MEDIQIIELYWSRDESAIQETDIKYGRLLKRIAQNILSNYEDSEECVNDTYGKAWGSMPPKRPDSLMAYLGRITRNLSVNRWHENHAAKRGGGENVLLSELSDCIPSGQLVEKELEKEMLTESISRWLESLSAEDRVLFVRRYWYGDALGVLAGECGSTANKLAGRLFRLRSRLREVLEKEGIVI